MDFFCRLLPPRASFAQDMTPGEGRLMREHAAYWGDGVARGEVVAFGLVGDPKGPYGIGIVRFGSAAEVQAFSDGDPVIRSTSGFRYEILPMPLGVVTAKPQ